MTDLGYYSGKGDWSSAERVCRNELEALQSSGQTTSQTEKTTEYDLKSKLGTCLLHLDRKKEAIEIFENLALEIESIPTRWYYADQYLYVLYANNDDWASCERLLVGIVQMAKASPDPPTETAKDRYRRKMEAANHRNGSPTHQERPGLKITWGPESTNLDTWTGTVIGTPGGGGLMGDIRPSVRHNIIARANRSILLALAGIRTPKPIEDAEQTAVSLGIPELIYPIRHRYGQALEVLGDSDDAQSFYFKQIDEGSRYPETWQRAFALVEAPPTSQSIQKIESLLTGLDLNECLSDILSQPKPTYLESARLARRGLVAPLGAELQADLMERLGELKIQRTVQSEKLEIQRNKKPSTKKKKEKCDIRQ